MINKGVVIDKSDEIEISRKQYNKNLKAILKVYPEYLQAESFATKRDIMLVFCDYEITKILKTNKQKNIETYNKWQKLISALDLNNPDDVIKLEKVFVASLLKTPGFKKFTYNYIGTLKKFNIE